MRSTTLRTAATLAALTLPFVTGCTSSIGSGATAEAASIPGMEGTSDPILVEFWATWCGPCKQFAPVVDKIAEERPSSVVVRRVDIDKEKDLAQAFRVRAVPTVVLVHRGKELGRFEGAKNKAGVERFIAEKLAAAR